MKLRMASPYSCPLTVQTTHRTFGSGSWRASARPGTGHTALRAPGSSTALSLHAPTLGAVQAFLGISAPTSLHIHLSRTQPCPLYLHPTPWHSWRKHADVWKRFLNPPNRGIQHQAFKETRAMLCLSRPEQPRFRARLFKQSTQKSQRSLLATMLVKLWSHTSSVVRRFPTGA